MCGEPATSASMVHDPLALEVVRALARAAASASVRRGLGFDMDDPAVARAVMEATQEALTGVRRPLRTA